MNIKKDNSKKIYLSFGNFDKLIVADCNAAGYALCPAVMMGFVSKDVFGSFILRQSSDTVSVRFVVNEANEKDRIKELNSAYYTVIKHVCDNCAYNKKVKVK